MLSLALALLLSTGAARTTVFPSPASTTREISSQKPQWAPSGNFSALHGSAVSPSKTRSGAGAYAREGRETAAAKRIWSYANLNPSRYTDPDGRCVFQSCSELWNDITGPEAPTGPQPATAISPSAPRAPAEFDWEASEDRKMRERFDYYLYEQQAPSSPELLGWGVREAQKQEWEAKRTRARNVVEGMQTVENVSRWYLREVAAPYLIAEGAGLLAGQLGGAVGRGVMRDVATQVRTPMSVETDLLRLEARSALEQTVADVRLASARRMTSASEDSAQLYRELGGFEPRPGLENEALSMAAGPVPPVPSGTAGAPATKSLLPGEGLVGTYDDLLAAGSKGDNLTPHHIPSKKHMARHGVPESEGIAVTMEHPHPGAGGRHRRTFTYGTQADVDLIPRRALAQGIWDARKIYKADGLYGPKVRSALLEAIRLNRAARPGLFTK